LRVSGSLYVTSNLFFHELVNISALLKELLDSDDMSMSLMASVMKEKYDKYWGDPEKINLLIFVAVVLDPRYKLEYVEWMLVEVYGSSVGNSLAKKVKEALFLLFEEYRGSHANDAHKEETSATSRDDNVCAPSHKKIEMLKNKWKKRKYERG
jgi:uncharacterized protein DUF4413